MPCDAAIGCDFSFFEPPHYLDNQREFHYKILTPYDIPGA
jgi:hypothetical protein